mgnify:CR=1 FL=1
MTKKGYEAVAEVLSGPIRDRLEELEHQDVYEFVVSEIADKFSVEFDNFDEDKFIDAT